MTTVTEVKNGKTFTIPAYNGEVPAGKVFHAWNTRADGCGAVFKVGKKVKMVESLHLYPIFVDANANDALEDDTEEESE